jgi:hypothetical protein
MPNNQNYDRYNMRIIYSPPWLRRSDRDATDPEFLESTMPARRALMGDYARPRRPVHRWFPGHSVRGIAEIKAVPYLSAIGQIGHDCFYVK